MRRRCPTAQPIARATLLHYRLVFPRDCQSWDGGVAGIESAVNQQVEGAVYLLQQADLYALNDYEGIEDGDYTHGLVDVTLKCRTVMKVMTYIAVRQCSDDIPPSRRYLQAIVEGARDHDLPLSWIDFLETHHDVAGT